MKKICAKGRRVLLISDTHIPYHHIDYLRFLKAVKEAYFLSDDIFIHIGDEIDGHAISMHPSDADLLSAGDELRKSIEHIHLKSGLYETFPKLHLLESNHGSLIFRRAKVHGLPMHYIKQYKDILETPDWSWHESILLSTNNGKVYCCHGKSGSYGKLMKEMGCSSIQGHHHGKFEITWHATALGARFNMIIGCLINRDSLAFAYGRNNIPQPILGVGMLTKEGHPRLIKMDLTKGGRWTGNLP